MGLYWILIWWWWGLFNPMHITLYLLNFIKSLNLCYPPYLPLKNLFLPSIKTEIYVLVEGVGILVDVESIFVTNQGDPDRKTSETLPWFNPLIKSTFPVTGRFNSWKFSIPLIIEKGIFREKHYLLSLTSKIKNILFYYELMIIA